MNGRPVRHTMIAVLIVAAAWWSVASAKRNDARAADAKPDYPNDHLLADADWLEKNQDGVTILDVRTDEYYDGAVIPGAVRLPWSLFRNDEKTRDVASTFVGVAEAEKILGAHGVARRSRVVLYDSVERDGGATASYVFWVLDMLGHPDKRILDGGIDAWKRAGGETVKTPADPAPVTYDAPFDTIRRERLIDGAFLYDRLDDVHYMIVDVRFEEEYVGEVGTKGMNDEPLKLGHIPGAYNIRYTEAWVDDETKMLRSAAELRNLYAGLVPERTVVVYCNSGRRSSFSYFVLRLMGFPRVITYEPSWKEWGNPNKHFPVETEKNALPDASAATVSTLDLARTTDESSSGSSDADADSSSRQSDGNDSVPAGGYVSCGG